MDAQRASQRPTVRFVQFDAPQQVSVRSEPLGECKMGEVQVRTEFSAVSTGTELLLYNGRMPTDVAADQLFETQQQPFSYPCRYGYAAVGTVTQSHDETVPTGSTVFAFREHCSHFCEKASNVLLVARDVDMLDACFLPGVETALSLAFDANILPGETVTIVGQGMVGLLLTAVLRRLHPYSRIVTVDSNGTRRQLSVERAGADYSFDAHEANGSAMRALFPAGTDVSVDVTGRGEGLQTAICSTRDHGRVVIGSWYGSSCVELPRLGARFHRSHMQLVASQVSALPPRLAGRWTKKRRFDLAWRLLRDIAPARRFAPCVLRVDAAPRAYAQLARGAQLQVLFRYHHQQQRQQQQQQQHA